MKLQKLTPEEEAVIVDKATEPPFTGIYNDFNKRGTYFCKRCDAKLFESKSKFPSDCGWPSFDDEVKGAITRTPDADGMRTEITCSNCGAHLGHVFIGEKLTKKNTRYCVNSISMNFKPAKSTKPATARALFAGGCFWGMEYHFKKVPGVLKTTVGYMGGKKAKPTYEQVSSGETDHFEAIEVVFDPKKVRYEALAKLFFEIHDPTQKNGQGPDIGSQYLSAIFYLDENQKKTAETLIALLREKGFDVVTLIRKAGTFYPAETHHQNYYEKTGGQPYCHVYTKRF